ncbi:MAG: hypothetical protein AAGD14_15790 [Planctomycetota bacterium]
MTDALPRPAALSALLFLVLLVAVLAWPEPQPGPGPLEPLTRAALVFLAIVGPSVRGVTPRQSLAIALLVLPFLALTLWGHAPSAWAGALVLLLFASLAGALGAGRPMFLPSMLLLFAVPYGLDYLAEEFGRGSGFWRTLSPWSLHPLYPSLAFAAWALVGWRSR